MYQHRPCGQRCKGSLSLQKAVRRFNKLVKRQTLHRKRKSKIKKEKRLSKVSKFEDSHFEDDTEYDRDMSDDITGTKCLLCSKEFSHQKGLSHHYERVHEPKIYKCDKCPRSYSRPHILREHVKESHTFAICAICGKNYKGMHGLKQHLVSHNMLKCENCGKLYKSRQAYRQHVKAEICTKPDEASQRPKKKFCCDICSKKFTYKGTLKVHISFEHENGKAFACSWCHRKFPALSRLKSHIVKHTRERNFTCETCGGKFVTKAALLYHTRIHTGETPYKCHHCDMRFLSTSRRMDHVRRKHVESSYKCQVCGSIFKTKYALTRHARRHENPNSKLFVQCCNETETVSVNRFC